MFNDKLITASDKVLLGCAAALVFVSPVAHVIAARNLLLVLLLFWLSYEFIRKPGLRRLVTVGWAAPTALVLLGCWLLIVSFAVDANPVRSLDELKGEWLPAFASFWVGLLLVTRICGGKFEARVVLRPLFFSLLSLAALQFAIAVWYWLSVGALPIWFGGISDHKWTITHVNTITASLLIAEATTVDQRLRPLGLRLWTLVGSFALVLTTTYISGTRNGIIVLLILMSFGALIWLQRFGTRHRKVFWGVLGILSVFAFVAFWAMLEADPRWKRFVATVPVAWNIDATDAWLNAYEKGLPIAADGSPVDQSTFERIAWARAGGRLVMENPLGIGVTRHAFRELMQAKYGEVLPAHSHNGYIDLALSVGLPGLVIWLIFVGALVVRGAAAGLGLGLASGTALMLLVVGFSIRAGIDSTLRDHMLEQFMFFAGVLLAAVGTDLAAQSRQLEGKTSEGSLATSVGQVAATK